MEALLPSSSILAAFIGGMLALAAPCCVTFLLPAYLGGVYRARAAVLAMTFVFGLGIAVVILPIALGVAALSRALNEWHTEIFILGAAFLLFLGAWSLMGKNLTLPFRPSGGPSGAGVLPVFGLGVFSGAASSCCAPVLIGVLTLTALTSSVPQATGVALAYVFGMVFPLLAAAYFWERFDLSQSFIFRGRPLELRCFGLRYRIHSTNLIAGLIFWALGALILALTFTGQLTQATEAQTSLFDNLQSASDFVLDRTAWLPGFVTGAAVGILFLFLLSPTVRGRKRRDDAIREGGKNGSGSRSCHEPEKTLVE